MDESHPPYDTETAATVQLRARRWPFVVSIIVLGLLAAALAVGFVYSTNSAQEWRSSAQASAKDLADMTKQRNALNRQLEEIRTQLGDITAKHNEATERIRSLSNEKAQSGDNAAYLASLLVLSQQVTSGMDACIRDLQGLQKYLVDVDSYDFAELSNYSRSINSGCNQARADSDALSGKLASGG